MIYKVVSKGTCVDFTKDKRSAESTFKDSGPQTKLFAVFPDGSAKLLQVK